MTPQEKAIHIIEEIIEPLFFKAQREDWDLEDGLNGTEYDITFTKIVEILNK